MDYAAVSHFAQTFGLAMLVILFGGVLAYALWPGNKSKFQRAARAPLQDDEADKETQKDSGDGRQE